MKTFWLKITGLAVVVLGLIILVNVFSSSESEPEPEVEPKPKTFWEQVKQDDERLRTEPQFKKPPKTSPSAQRPNQRRTVKSIKPVELPKPQFKKLSQEDEIYAQRLFNLAIQERKMGRLPGVRLGYKKMVDHCREIIQRWPDSEYAFKAKRMLSDIPERYRKMYNITDEEIDLGNLR